MKQNELMKAFNDYIDEKIKYEKLPDTSEVRMKIIDDFMEEVEEGLTNFRNTGFKSMEAYKSWSMVKS